MMQAPYVQAWGLTIRTPEGRTLIDQLTMLLGADPVAIIGRNGVGKSTLLEVLAGLRQPDAGRLACAGRSLLVPQNLGPSPRGLSRGELRRNALQAALEENPALLLLDEPGDDLDEDGVQWLLARLRDWRGGLVVVSHQPRVLREFQHFFLVEESGCRYLPGNYSELLASLEEQSARSQRQYLRNLTALERREEHHARVRRRRARKRNGGRIREIDRAPSRALLNLKRSYAQESQGKRAKLAAQRIEATRTWAGATRRALTVALPLEPLVPALGPDEGHVNLALTDVGKRHGDRWLFADIDLRVGRQRIAVTGPNGAGKSSLLQIMLGHTDATTGSVQRRAHRIGSIAQGASDWMDEESLLARLIANTRTPSPDYLARLLVSHKFPLALAERPLRSLSPGERFRAALLCLFERSESIELLILDEPTFSLDLVATHALRVALRAWRGGLIVASHDREFLRNIEMERELLLGPGAVNDHA